MSRLTEAYGWHRSAPGSPRGPASATRDAAAIWRRVGRWYLLAGGVVGAFMLLVAIVGARAADSVTAMSADLVAALLQPMPMIAFGLGIQRRQAWAQRAAIVFPFVIIPAARALRFLRPVGPNDFLFRVVNYVVGGQNLHLPASAILACVVFWQLAADQLDKVPATVAAAARVDVASRPRSRWQRIGQWYMMLGAVVGAPMGFLLIVGTQAARSTGEMYSGFLSAALQLVPMLGLGFAIEREQRWARYAAIAFPVLIFVGQLALRGYPLPSRANPRGDVYDTIYYFVYGQRYYLPFAVIMAAVIIHAFVRERR
jgi:hypothetical protein